MSQIVEATISFCVICKVMARSWQDLARTCNIFKRSWHVHIKILARSSHDLGKILQPARFLKDLGKFMSRSWQDYGKTMAQSCNLQDF